jgi:hypothetical protein
MAQSKTSWTRSNARLRSLWLSSPRIRRFPGRSDPRKRRDSGPPDSGPPDSRATAAKTPGRQRDLMSNPDSLPPPDRLPDHLPDFVDVTGFWPRT